MTLPPVPIADRICAAVMLTLVALELALQVLGQSWAGPGARVAALALMFTVLPRFGLREWAMTAIALGLAAGGCRVVGVDVNAGAVAAGNEAATAAAAAAGAEGGSAEFMAGDCCTAVGLAHTLGERAAGGFGVALAQLLISVVGGPAERAALLAALHSQLQPGGTLMLSASAVSDDINPEYAEAYRRGLVETGEQHTYYSRDELGAALYRTHHFTFEELSALVRGAGFVLVSMNKEREVSSRRSDQAAWFLYVVAAKVDVPYRAPPAADASGL